MKKKTFEERSKEFYESQQQRLEQIVREAMQMVEECRFDDKQKPFAQMLLRELDGKLREAGYRLNHLCELAAQSPRAAEELVGG